MSNGAKSTQRSSRTDEAAETSLYGEQGMEVARNIARISLGLTDVSDLGPAYGWRSDGVLVVQLDEQSRQFLSS
jgi:hypothetical protein